MSETFKVVVRMEPAVTADELRAALNFYGSDRVTVTPMDDALIEAADVWDEAKHQFYRGPGVYYKPVDTRVVPQFEF